MKNMINKIKEKQIKNRFKRIVQEEKANPSTWNSRLDREAEYFEEKGFYNEAIELYCMHAQAHADNGGAYYRASKVALKQRDLEKQKELLIKYAESRNRDEYKEVAELELIRTGNLEQAVDYYRKSGMDPLSIVWYLDKNVSNKRSKKFKEQVRSLRKEQIEEYKSELESKMMEVDDLKKSISKLEELTK